MIERDLSPQALAAAARYPVVAVTGPRQSGKTTFCRAVFPEHEYVSLENPEEQLRARQDPRGFLARFAGKAILDEIQRAPDLMSYLQGIVDEEPAPGRWILTGSQHFVLTHSISQSLAGRVALLDLLPPSLGELRRFPKPPDGLFETLFVGAYPRIHDQGLPPQEWLANYLALYVERDVRELLNVGDLVAYQTFVRQVAGRSAQLVNLSGLGADCGISHPTVRKWLSVLETSFLVFRVPPFLRNLRRRLVKTPKLHFFDSGLLCHLLGIRSAAELVTHPLRGAIFESWVVSEVVKTFSNRGQKPRLSFYRDQRGTEIDLVLERGPEILAIEVKSGQTVTAEFFGALAQFERTLEGGARAPVGVDRIVVYGGDRGQQRTDVRVLSWRELDQFDWVGAA